MQETSYCLEDVYRELYRRKLNIKVDRLRDIKVDSNYTKEPKKHLNSLLKLMGIDLGWIQKPHGQYFYSFSKESFDFLVSILENATASQSFLKNLRNNKSINPANLGQHRRTRKRKGPAGRFHPAGHIYAIPSALQPH